MDFMRGRFLRLPVTLLTVMVVAAAPGNFVSAAPLSTQTEYTIAVATNGSETETGVEGGGLPCNDTACQGELSAGDTGLPCNNTACQAVNGSWSEWGEWQNCSASCGTGNMTRYRTCNNPAPLYGGTPCNGTSEESYPCDTNISCPSVDGGWSEWSDWSACSVTCGGGGRTSRSRICNNPVPMHGGLDCVGDGDEIRPCPSPICPAPQSHWNQWGAWGECQANQNCSPSYQIRQRQCPGNDCPGVSVQLRLCTINTTGCP
ncbi:coadhesin-like [Acanthaster planci]|uniref:Coadhesin-like n=1 Tax=Acanthaster planci TaxID=133434 RepID=A0A8B7XMB3_ACAPL|nr:coadhesin-like [Acanthaster planci]